MKLKHRITGTILAIAFATTTVLPAATIPQLKSPPKAVTAPRIPAVQKVSIPAAPKVPVIPKVVTAPKVPVVKVPAVKVPVVPKVVSAPKIPVVKVPTVKVPVTPRIVSAPKIPAVKAVPKIPTNPHVVSAPKVPATQATARIPVTPKAILASNRAVAGKVSSKMVPPTNTTIAASGIRQAIRDAKNNNPKSAPDVGVKTGLPSLPDRDVKIGGRSSGEKPGTGGRKIDQNLVDVLTGKGGKTTGSGLFGDLLPDRSAPALADISQNGKGFDQGFAAKPDNASLLAAAERGSSNPVTQLTSGSIGGPLGEAASQAGNGRSGPADLGFSLISDGGAASTGGGATTDADGEVKARANPKGFFDYLKDKFGISEKEANQGSKRALGIGENRNGYEVLNDPDGDPAAPSPGTAPTPAAEPVPANDKTVKGSSDGRTVVVTDTDGTKNVYVGGKKVGAIAPDGTITPTKSAGQPDPENEGAVPVDVVGSSSSMLDQIRQSRTGKKGSQGGSGDMTPTEDSSGPVRSGTIGTTVGTQIKNSLVGNPGQNGGMREGSGTANAAPVRSNGTGTITPTDDQNVSSSGGRQEDAGDFFGNDVGPDQSRLNGSDSSSSSSSTSSSTSDKKAKKSK